MRCLFYVLNVVHILLRGYKSTKLIFELIFPSQILKDPSRCIRAAVNFHHLLFSRSTKFWEENGYESLWPDDLVYLSFKNYDYKSIELINIMQRAETDARERERHYATFMIYS